MDVHLTLLIAHNYDSLFKKIHIINKGSVQQKSK